MTEEPTDEECQTMAMLTGYTFLKDLTYFGRKSLYRYYTKGEDGVYVQHMDPVTLEVMGEMTAHDHHKNLREARAFMRLFNDRAKR